MTNLVFFIDCSITSVENCSSKKIDGAERQGDRVQCYLNAYPASWPIPACQPVTATKHGAAINLVMLIGHCADN